MRNDISAQKNGISKNDKDDLNYKLETELYD